MAFLNFQTDEPYLSSSHPPAEERTPVPGMHIYSTLPSSRVRHAIQSAHDAMYPRLQALDAFRGLTIVLMLLVNNLALDTATPRQLTHAGWHAMIHLADLVFPWFLFCVGVAIPFAAGAFKKKGLPAWRYEARVLTRALLLAFLGMLIDSSALRHPTFTLGVLQLIALAYLVGALLYDLPLFRRQLIAGVLLAGYWAAIMFIPVPGVGTGVVREHANLIYYLNQHFLDPVNLWGLPSVIPTASLVLIGAMIGDLLRDSFFSRYGRTSALLLAGAVLVVAGYIWHLHLPFNKPLWTPSYILFTAGLASLALGVLYMLIDAPRWPWWPRWWAYPLQVFGANAILAYVAPILIKFWVLQEWTVHAGGQTVTLEQWLLTYLTTHCGRVNGGWLYTGGYILCWWVILWLFYRKRLFLRV